MMNGRVAFKMRRIDLFPTFLKKYQRIVTNSSALVG